MKNVDVETMVTFYDQSADPIVVDKGPEENSARKLFPKLRDANGKLVPPRRVADTGIAFEAKDFAPGVLDDAAKRLKITNTQVLADLNFGLVNKMQGRLRSTVQNPTKAPSAETMRAAVLTAMLQNDTPQSEILAVVSAKKDRLVELYSKLKSNG